MSDIRFNQWLHQSGTGGVSQVASGAVGVGTTNPLADFYVRGDAQITGILTAGHIAMGSSITFGDNDRIYLGDGTDFQLYHASSDNNSYIVESGAGSLVVNASKLHVKNAANNEDIAVFNQSGNNELYFSNSKKFETTNTGVYITGIVTATNHVRVTGSQNSKLTSNQLIFDRAGTSYIDNENNSGSLSFRVSASNTVGLHIDSNADVHIPSKLIHSGDTDTFMEFTSNNIHFETGGDERFRIAAGGQVNIGGNYTQTTAPLCVTTTANAYGIRLQTGSNVVTEILNNDAAGNSEVRGYYNNNSGTRGEGYRLEANGDTFFNPGGVTGLKIRANNGYVGAGKGTPGCALDVLHTADQLVARFLSSHNTLGGGVQVKNNNARGGLEFLNKDGSNVGGFYHSTGGWTWDQNLQITGSAGLRIGTTSGSGLINAKTSSADAIVKIESESGYDARLQLDTSNGGGAGAHLDFQMDGTTKGGIEYVNNASNAAVNSMIFRTASNTERVRIDANGKVTIGDGNELADSYSANLLVDGGSGSKLTITGSTTGWGQICFADGSSSGATRTAGFLYMNHADDLLSLGLADVNKLFIRNPGSQRGQVEIYGSFNEETTPALEINHGNDARKVYMTNSSGDLALWTRNASRIGGKLKMWENGQLRHTKVDPDNAATQHNCFVSNNYKVASGSTNQSNTYTTQYIIAGGFGGDEGMYCGRTNFEVSANNNDHYQPVAFLPMGYNLDHSSFGGHWFGELWINQSGSQKPSSRGGTNTSWATMTAHIKWDCAHWNAKPNMNSVVHYVNYGQANIGKLKFSGTKCHWVGWFLPGYYAVQYRINKGLSIHTATSAGGSIVINDSNTWQTHSSLAYSSRNTNFDSAIMYGGNGSHST